MKFLKLQLIPFLFITATISAQNNESWRLYDDTEVATVKITIDPAALEWLYNNVESDSLFYAQFYFKNKYIEETVDSVGFRLRGNTSRYSQKKSFKVSFNDFIPGRNFYGVDKLNLNGEHNDPSIVRSKLCWDLFKKVGMKSSRAAYADVYINDQYYGLYISVEHIDDEFLQKNFADDTGNLWKCLYPADLNYLGDNPDLYKSIVGGNDRQAYDLKTNESENNYYQLAHLIDIVNNTPDNLFADSLESIIYIDELLKYFSMDILTGSWDDYWSLMNNYYLYYEPAAEKFHLIPFDYDNTFGIDWSGNDWAIADPYNFPQVVSGYRPLAQRMMQNNQYRDLYTHFLEFYRENLFLLPLWEDRIDSLRIMITPSALADSFRTYDYNFSFGDFLVSYTDLGYSNQHVKYGLKQYINRRNETLPDQLSYLNSPPLVYNIDWSPKIPGPDDSIYVSVSAFSSIGMNEVSIQFTPDGSSAEVYPMNYSPVPGTKKVEEADKWIGVIPPRGYDKSGSFRIYVNDLTNQSQLYPRTESIKINLPTKINNDIVINEFLSDNVTTNTDPAGEYDDWIELYNPSSDSVLLTGRYLTDKPDNLTKWQFTQPDLYLHSKEFLIIWCDEDQDQEGIHTNFKLNSDGEFIAFTSTDGISVIDSITFGLQVADVSYGRYPDAEDNWDYLVPTPGTGNILTDVKDKIIPKYFSLTAYPNPFNPSTTIQYQIPELNKVHIEIFDLLGKRIWFRNIGEQQAGEYEIRWNGTNQNGVNVSSGIYLLRIESGILSQNYKLMLIK